MERANVHDGLEHITEVTIQTSEVSWNKQPRFHDIFINHRLGNTSELTPQLYHEWVCQIQILTRLLLSCIVMTDSGCPSILSIPTPGYTHEYLCSRLTIPSISVAEICGILANVAAAGYLVIKRNCFLVYKIRAFRQRLLFSQILQHCLAFIAHDFHRI